MAQSTITSLEKEKQMLKENEIELRAVINQSVTEHNANVRYM